jgi:hypothetical protein
MNDSTPSARAAVRASDAEREQTVALLQRSYADGRLALAELEERAGAAYAAQTRAQLRDLTADLPAEHQPSRPHMIVNTRVVCVLPCVCPPAALAYWLLSVRQTAQMRAWLRNARRWQQALAGTCLAGARAALEIVSHLAGAVLVSAGVIVALPAMSAPIRRTWVSCAAHFRRAARSTR